MWLSRERSSGNEPILQPSIPRNSITHLKTRCWSNSEARAGIRNDIKSSMRLVSWKKNGTQGLAARRGSQLVTLEGLDLMTVLKAGQAGIDRARALSKTGPFLDESALTYLPPLTAPPKIVCVGINYWDHARENKLETPAHPTFFARY